MQDPDKCPKCQSEDWQSSNTKDGIIVTVEARCTACGHEWAYTLRQIAKRQLGERLLDRILDKK